MGGKEKLAEREKKPPFRADRVRNPLGGRQLKGKEKRHREGILRKGGPGLRKGDHF